VDTRASEIDHCADAMKAEDTSTLQALSFAYEVEMTIL
jgi:hypothetical protein